MTASRRFSLSAIVGIALAIFSALMSYMEYRLVGFPDGYLTRFDKLAISTLYPIFMGVCLLFLIVFIGLLLKKKSGKSWLSAFIFFLVFYIFLAYYLYVSSAANAGG